MKILTPSNWTSPAYYALGMSLLLTACTVEQPKYTTGNVVKHKRGDITFTINKQLPQKGRQVFYKATRNDGVVYNKLAQNSIKQP